MSPESHGLRYALVTPARNEARYIGGTLDSVIAQTCPPVRWVIVSDGSTDGTDDIVAQYMRRVDWIELVRLQGHRDRSFAAKVHSFNAALEKIKDLDFHALGSLDADITFEADYFEFLLARFADNPSLGVAGTPFVEQGRQYDYRFTNIAHVSGACQLFRRQCFEDIGGYVPIKGGGIDWTAVTTARMRGWQTRTFTEKTCVHHRPIGTASGSRLQALFRHGRKDYYLGGHPLWQVCRGAYQITRSPYVIGGLSLLAGYSWALLCRTERPIPADLMQFHRAEQMARLKNAFTRLGRARICD